MGDGDPFRVGGSSGVQGWAAYTIVTTARRNSEGLFRLPSEVCLFGEHSLCTVWQSAQFSSVPGGNPQME